MNHKTLQQFLPFAHKNKIPTILWGPTGIGKTTGFYEYGKAANAKVVVLHLASQEPGDLVGLPTREGLNLTADQQASLVKTMLEARPNADVEEIIAKLSRSKTTWSRPEWLPPEDDDGQYIFFLDEFNRAPKYVLACMFPFILEGKLHTHRVPKNSWIVAAANPGGGENYDVTEIRDRALISRLCHIRVVPTKDEWLIRHDGIVARAVHSVVAKHPEILAFDSEPLGFEIQSDARALHRLGEALKTITKDEWSLFGYEFCEGCVGKTAAAYIEKEWKNSLESISPEEVLNSYSKIRPDVKAFSDVKTVKMEVLAGCNSKLLVYIKKMGDNKHNVTDVQLKNLTQYLKDIPRDSAQAFLSQVATGDEYCTEKIFADLMIRLGLDEDLYIYILEANNKKEAQRERDKKKEKEKIKEVK